MQYLAASMWLAVTSSLGLAMKKSVSEGRRAAAPSSRRAAASACALGVLALLGACGGSSHPPPPETPAPTVALRCDDTMKTAFKPDANTSVVLVKAYKAGDPLALSGTAATPAPMAAPADLCLVKLNVGPGHAGAAGAPSTSPGIGMEIWLPTAANWNTRIQNLGGGGWQGGNHGSPTLLSTQASAAAATAATGYAVGTTDTGHSVSNGSFAMREDGSINTALWTDFAERSLHELALKTKALVQAYYTKPQQYAYWNGCSTGGRQGYKIAQTHPEDYDGYLNGAPAFNWTKFITSELNPQVAMQQELGGPIAFPKLNALSAAAVSACDTVGGAHLGFIADPGQCRYDPTRDAAALCSGVQGIGGVVGTNATASCVTLLEAQVVNKIWYGQTADGGAPDPALDNGNSATLASNQLWWGLTRGTNLGALAGSNPFPIATDMVALELQDPTYATPSFLNATGNGANKWKQLTYSGLANAYARGIALQSAFGNINSDDPDLRPARDKGAKIISYHGLADQLITPAGSLNYYTRVSDVVGGAAETNKFNRLYFVPAMGHCAGIGTVSGSAGPAADANRVPLPTSNQFFDALVAWVETKSAPESLVLKSADASVSMPVCPHPQKAVYKGSGAITEAASYSCQ